MASERKPSERGVIKMALVYAIIFVSKCTSQTVTTESPSTKQSDVIVTTTLPPCPEDPNLADTLKEDQEASFEVAYIIVVVLMSTFAVTMVVGLSYWKVLERADLKMEFVNVEAAEDMTQAHPQQLYPSDDESRVSIGGRHRPTIEYKSPPSFDSSV